MRSLLDAHLSSHEETIFGDFLESLAIFINGECFGGRKSSTEGIDLEFDKDSTRYLVSIKSGPNWGNSSQIKKMRDNFKTAAKIVRQRNPATHVVAVNGCCYGREGSPDKGDYRKYCGQSFWEFVSGSPTLYTDIIEPLGHRAKERNDDFIARYADVWNRFTQEFMTAYCSEGRLRWDAFVRLNSSNEKPQRSSVKAKTGKRHS